MVLPGAGSGWVDSVCDLRKQRGSEGDLELLAGEMSHRVKNLLHVAAGLTAITARSAKSTEDMARDLTHRLIALGRAHDLVRPAPGQENKAALLGDLLAVLLAPSADTDSIHDRVRISLPKLGVGEETATTLALVVQEMTTNSLKYGALPVASGTLDVSCPAQCSELVILWTERGGPAVVAPTAPRGFGSKMVKRGMSDQLGGSIGFDWPRESLIVMLRMNKDRPAA